MSALTGIRPEEFTRAKAEIDAGRSVSDLERDGEQRDCVEQREAGWLDRLMNWFLGVGWR